MIKVKITEVEKNGKDFPKIMEAKDVPGFFVLFFNEEYGTCLVSKDDYSLGERYDRSSQRFKDFNGKITIQNA